MASNEHKIRVENIPSGTRENRLNLLFSNTRKQGGGKVRKVELSSEDDSAIVTFEEKEAVNVVLGKGDHVKIDETRCKITRFSCELSRDEPSKICQQAQPDGGYEEKKNATVEILLKDFIDHYEHVSLYFGDNFKFYEEKIFMDGLKKAVYVTFHSSEEAGKACSMDFSQFPNMRSIKMADDDDLNHYDGEISIHGMDFSSKEAKDKLKQYVRDKTKTTPIDVFQKEEPFSSILYFDKRVDVYQIAWKCVGQLDGVQLFTAPVKKSASVYVISNGLNKALIENYFKNSKKSGGGPIKSCKPVNDGFILTFEKFQYAESVVKKSHQIGNDKLTVEKWYHCLSKDAFSELHKLPSTRNILSSHLSKPIQKPEGKETLYQPERHVYALLKRSGLMKSVEESPDLVIEIDDQTGSVTIKGNDIKVLNVIREKELDFEAVNLEGIDKKICDLMQTPQASQKLNDILDNNRKVAYIEVKGNNIICHFDHKKEEATSIKELIMKNITIKEETIGEKISALICNEGKTFFKELKKNHCENPYKINLEKQKKTMEIIMIGEHKEFAVLWYDIDTFMTKHKIEKKTIVFTNFTLQYAERYLKEELSSIVERLKKSGVEVDVQADQIVVTGVQSEINEAEKDISSIRKKITVQDEKLSFFGIMEFLSRADGKDLLELIGKNHECILALDLPGATQVKVLGSCDVGSLEVKFVHGEITSLDVNVIVSPINSALGCKSGVSRAVVQNGGEQIQKELNGHNGSQEPGDIVVTKGGRLPCSAIFHLILEENNFNVVKPGIKDCLRRAEQDGYKSIAMPLVGCGKFGIPQLRASRDISKTIEEFATKESNINEIIICDMDRQNMKSIMSRFQIDNVDENEGQSDDEASPGGHHHYKQRGDKYSGEKVERYGVVSLTLKKGDILEEKCDVVACGIKDDMDLTKGGAVSKKILSKCGSSLNTELSQKATEFETSGVVETSANGLSTCSAIIFANMTKYSKKWHKGVEKVLTLAEAKGHTSIALPAFGTGSRHANFKHLRQSILDGIERFGESKPTTLKDVRLVIYDAKILTTFCEDASDSDDEDFPYRVHHSTERKDTSSDEKKKNYGPVSLTIKKGDILKEKCDAVTCGIKEDLNLKYGGAVSKKMKEMCGSALQTECDKKVEEMKKYGIIQTSANGLPMCSAIIFVSITKYGKSWDEGVLQVLSSAEANGHKSIALPAVGTGSKHANVKGLRQAILSAVEKFGKSKPKKLHDVRLVIYDRSILRTFLENEDNAHSKPRRHHRDSKHGHLPISNVSDTANLKVVYQNSTNGRDAFKKLKEKCEKWFFEKEYKELNINEFSQKEIAKLTNDGLKKIVRVTVQRDKGVLTLASFDKEAVVQMGDKIHKLSDKVKEKQHQRELESLETAFKWQFLRKERWLYFDDELNIQIEKAYKKKLKSHVFDDSKGRKYRIDFDTMKEFKIKGTDEEELTTVNRYDLHTGGEELPKTWCQMGSDNLKIMQLSRHDKEYQDVEAYFKKCGAQVDVKKIQRIQNEVLYRQYISKKNFFEKNNPKNTKNELQLFHGTDPVAVDNINASGFNRSFCGKNATAYGNGVYFAEESSYSVSYAKKDENGDRMMYLAKVLVGESTPSQSGMSFLPNKPNKNVPYDSGRGPKMYIIFHDCQAYPEYLITF